MRNKRQVSEVSQRLKRKAHEKDQLTLAITELKNAQEEEETEVDTATYVSLGRRERECVCVREREIHVGRERERERLYLCMHVVALSAGS